MPSQPVTVCVCGQTPPPLHGQAIMIQALLAGAYSQIRIHPVRMAFSSQMDEVGLYDSLFRNTASRWAYVSVIAGEPLETPESIQRLAHFLGALVPAIETSPPSAP